MSFKRSSVTQTRYLLEGSPLSNVTIQKDMGVILDPQLSFKPHLETIIKTSYKTLGGIIRIARNFHNTHTVKLLYNALVRSRLEYASVIWNPVYQSHVTEIEKVQKRFLRFLYFKKHGSYPHIINNPIRTVELEREFNIQSLLVRMKISDCMFLFKIINNHIDCRLILDAIPFKVQSVITRNNTTFHLPRCNSRYEESAFLYRLLKICNNLPINVDLYDSNLNNFKKVITTIFNS